MLNEFKQFIARGNAIDLAVGVIIGASFGKIVTSVVEDLIMPPIGLLLGRADFSNLFIPLKGQLETNLADARKAGAVLAYGNFITNVVQFLIVAFVIFLIVKAINNLKGPAPAPTTRDCPFCLTTVPLAATKCAHCTSEIPSLELS